MYGVPNPIFNPMSDYFRQQMQMAMPQQQQPQMQSPQFVTRQVSNIDEAKACMVDPLSTCLFVDYNAGRIYMKRMSNSGLTEFITFSAEQTQQPKNPLDEINRRLESIESKLGGYNVQPVSKSDADNAAKHDEPNASKQPAAFREGAGDGKRQV